MPRWWELQEEMDRADTHRLTFKIRLLPLKRWLTRVFSSRKAREKKAQEVKQ